MIDTKIEITCDKCHMPMIDGQNCFCQQCFEPLKKKCEAQAKIIELLEKEVESQKNKIILLEGGK